MISRGLLCLTLTSCLTWGCRETPAGTKPVPRTEATAATPGVAKPAPKAAETKPKAAPAPMPSANKNAVRRGLGWKVQKGKSTVYLVGSVHLGKPKLYPLPKAIDQAFESSPILVEELVLDESKQAEQFALFQNAGMYPPGDSLDRHLTPATQKLVKDNVGNLGLLSLTHQRMKPWFLATSVTVLELLANEFKVELGIDTHLAKRAVTAGKKYEGLETAEGQLKALSGLPAATQELMLKETLEKLSEVSKQLDQALDLWLAGDAATLDKVMMTSMRTKEYEPLMKALFLDRNKKMQEKIEAYLKTPETEFILVGAAHLIGPEGLIATLKSPEHTLEQL